MELLPRMRGYKIKPLSLFDPLSPPPLPEGGGFMGQRWEDIYLCAAYNLKTVSHYAARTKAIYPA